MNRRNFLRLLIAIPLAAKLSDIPFTTSRALCKKVLHNEYEAFIIFNMNMYVDNPARLCRITGITESELDQ